MALPSNGAAGNPNQDHQPHHNRSEETRKEGPLSRTPLLAQTL
jgi:hypothetical protein